MQVMQENRPRTAARTSRAEAMARFGEALHRALAPSLMPDPRRPGWAAEYLKGICDAGVARVAADPGAQPMAARSLFSSARTLMRAQDQLRVAQIIDAHLDRARAYFEAEPGPATAGGAARCAALNRKGKPCGREPMWGTPYCVSHTERPPGG